MQEERPMLAKVHNVGAQLLSLGNLASWGRYREVQLSGTPNTCSYRGVITKDLASLKVV